MATSFDFGYGNPANFSDWASYAGFDRKSGTLAAAPSEAGVPPPETFGDMFEQKVAKPFSNAVQGVQTFGTNMSNAARGIKPAQQPQQPAQQPTGWNLPSHIED